MRQKERCRTSRWGATATRRTEQPCSELAPALPLARRSGVGSRRGQSRVVSESMATVIARMSGASSPAATSTP
jgi:hypothetical protein